MRSRALALSWPSGALSLLLAACASDRIVDPTSARSATAVRSHAPHFDVASTDAGYVVGQRDGNTWTLYPTQGIVVSQAGDTVPVSPAVAAYFQNVAQTAANADAADAYLRQSIARHSLPNNPPSCGTKRICNTAVGPVISGPSVKAAAAAGPDALAGFGPAGTWGGPLLVAPAPIGATLTANSSGSTDPSAFVSAASLQTQLSLDEATSGPGQTCRDIATAWGKMEANVAAAKANYQAAGALVWGQSAAAIGSWRFNPPDGQEPIPSPDPQHPDYSSIKNFLKSFTDVKQLAAWLVGRYGQQASVGPFDIAAANLMSLDTQRGIYASLYNAYNCANTAWQTDQPVTASNPGGGGGTTPRRALWCYYMVTYVNGNEVSRNFIGCW